MKKQFFIFFILFLFVSAPLCGAASLADGNTPIKILLVPGHDQESVGAQYGKVQEASMNLAVAKRIHTILRKDKRFKVYLTRRDKGYTKDFETFFSREAEAIQVFREKVKKETQAKIASGAFVTKKSPPHNKASESAATRLYGFNKWANDNAMDAVIHIHFNDEARPDIWTVGKYKGFAIYVPEEQMANSKESMELGKSIFDELKEKYTTSTQAKEKGGLLPDQTLIALGSNGSLLPAVRSVLIEYGYIYEKKLRSASARQRAYDTMAKLTAKGIENYFFPE